MSKKMMRPREGVIVRHPNGVPMDKKGEEIEVNSVHFARYAADLEPVEAAAKEKPASSKSEPEKAKQKEAE